MIKETISYEDIDGNSKTMDAYFHLTMREMRQLLKDGIQDKLDAVTSGKASTDTMFDLIDELIKASYGKRIEDNGEAGTHRDLHAVRCIRQSVGQVDVR